MSRRLSDRERLLRTVTEKEFTDQVVKLAKLAGWKLHHSRPAWSGGRMVTPLQGHSGLPDLVLVKPPRVIFAELKRQGVRVVPDSDQEQWLELLKQCPGVETCVWRPGDVAEVMSVLGGRPVSLVENYEFGQQARFAEVP